MASPSPVVRSGLQTLLGGVADFTVVGTTATASGAVERIADLEPDVVVYDVEASDREWPGVLGLGVPVVVLTDGPAGPALRAGARAVLPRVAHDAEIAGAVRAARDGLVALHPDALGAVLEGLGEASPRAPSAPGQPLTPREVEVLGMLAEGLGNKIIASRLGISDHTVKFHISSIFGKLNATSRTEAVTLGVRQGLILL